MRDYTRCENNSAWEKGQMCNLFLAITSFGVIKSEQCVQSRYLNKKLSLLNTIYR